MSVVTQGALRSTDRTVDDVMNPVMVLDVVATMFELRPGPMQVSKLHDLCYLAQGWSLVRLREPLFVEQIRAAPMGPVVTELSELHQGKWMVEYIPFGGSPDRLSESQRKLVDDVLYAYAPLSKSQLSTLVCLDEPYQSALLGRGVISNAALVDFFSAAPERHKLPMNRAKSRYRRMANV